MDLGRLVVTLGTDNREFMRGMQEAERRMNETSQRMAASLERVGDQMQATGRRMRSIGVQMSLAITAPLTAIGVASGRMAMSFESSMSRITGLVGVAQDQVEEWGRDILEMAPRLGKAPQELAEGLYFVTSAGHRGAAALDLLETSARAAAAGLGETKTIAHLVSSAMNAYGYETLNAKEATDILVAAVREGKAGPEELAASLGQLLPIASEMGVTFDQVGAAVAAMTRTGTEATVASTQLRQIMASLLRPTQQSEEAFQRMGTSSAQLRDMLAGPEGLVGVLGWLREATDHNSAAMAEIFPNIRALAGVLDLMGKNADENRAIFERMTDATGALDHAFGAASETAEFKLNQALAEGRAAMTALGDTVMQSAVPVIESLGRRLRALAEWWMDLDENTQQWIIRIGALLATLGPVLVILGQITIALGGLVKALKVVIPLKIALTRAVVAFNAALYASPLGVFVGVIGIATAAWWGYNRATRAVSDSQSELSNMQQEVTNRYREEEIRVRALVAIVEDENIVLEQRNNALRELQEIVPDYHASLTKEGKLINDNVEAIDAYLEKIHQQIQLQVHQETLKKIYEDREGALRLLNRTEERYNELQRRSATLTVDEQMELDTLNSQRNLANGLLENANERIEAVNAQMAENIEKTRASRHETEEFNNTLKNTGYIFQDLATQDFGEGLFDDINDELKIFDALWDGLQERLKAFDIRGQVDPEFDALAAKINATRNTIAQLIDFVARSEMDPGMMEPFLNTLKELKSELEATAEEMENAAETTDSFSMTMEQAANRAIVSFAEMVGEIAAGTMGIKGAFQGLLDTLLGVLHQLGELAIATGIAISGIRKALESLNPVAAIAAGAALIALVATVRAHMRSMAEEFEGGAGMASGGRVPPGFPGDSYPARLTSGETVFPPEDLNNVMLEMRNAITAVASAAVREIKSASEIPMIHGTVPARGQMIEVKVEGDIAGENIRLSNSRSERLKELVE